MSAPTPDAAAQLLFPPNIQYNTSRVNTLKFLSSCFAGAAAGVLGLENLAGFALLLASAALTSGCVYVQTKGRPRRYLAGGWGELVSPGQENVSSFVLLWTLFYGAWPASPAARAHRVLVMLPAMDGATVVTAGIVHVYD